MLTISIPLTHKDLTFSNPLSIGQFSSKREIETELALRLKENIVDQESLLKVAICLGVTPTTLRKILTGHNPSRYLLKKLSQRLQNLADPNEALLQSSKVQRLLLIHRLYQQKGTLAGVGKEVGLTRERVRQLLNNGESLGLFEYKKPEDLFLPSIPKEKLIEDYKNLLQFKLVAKSNGISLHRFYQMVKYYQITPKEFEAIRIGGHRLRSILQYYSFARKSGFHPSTAELQKTGKGRYLSCKITKLWGSIHSFRKELQIPSPKQKFKPI